MARHEPGVSEMGGGFDHSAFSNADFQCGLEAVPHGVPSALCISFLAGPVLLRRCQNPLHDDGALLPIEGNAHHLNGEGNEKNRPRWAGFRGTQCGVSVATTAKAASAIANV